MPRSRTAVVIAAGLIAAAATPGSSEGLANEGPKTERPGPSGLIGTSAPMFILRTLNGEVAGERYLLRDHVGPKARFPKKRVLLEFGASWCVPCRAKLRTLTGWAETLEAAGVGVAVVVIDDTPEGIATMRKMVTEELEVPFPVASDRFQVLAQRYRVDTLPLSVVIDDAGRVVHVQKGSEEGSLAELSSALGLAAMPAADAAE